MDQVNFNLLSSNAALKVEDKQIVRASFLERIYRFFLRAYAHEQDKRVAQFALTKFREISDDREKAEALRHIDAYSKFKSRTVVEFSQMQNVVTAAKVQKALPFLKENQLLNEQLDETELLTLIRKNFLHRVLPAVDKEHAHSAIIQNEDGELFIRSPKGESFLAYPDKLEQILATFPEEQNDRISHDYTRLREIRDNPALASDNEYVKGLHGTYTYLPLNQAVDKSKELTGTYWVNGVQDHDRWNFKELQPTLVRYGMPQFEGVQDELVRYEMRVVTKKPDYCASDSSCFEFMASLPNVTKHGHSFLELVEYEVKDGEYTGKEIVFDVGYFLRGRMSANDPSVFTPSSRGGTTVERFIVNERQFNRAKQIIEGVQSIMLIPNHNIRSKVPKDIKDPETINRVYKTVRKGTCLTFADVIIEEATGYDIDRRDWVRRAICPRRFYRRLDCLDMVLSYIPVVNYLFHGLALVNRGVVPGITIGEDRLYNLK